MWNTPITNSIIGEMYINAVGIDVSKGKSMVVIVQPFGVVVAEPFGVSHDGQALSGAREGICEAFPGEMKLLVGETRAVMEYTGAYYEPIANALYNAGIFVSAVNPLLINDFDTNCVRKVKTDKRDAFKIANYALSKWLELREYIPDENTRKMLKILNRRYTQHNKLLVMHLTVTKMG